MYLKLDDVIFSHPLPAIISILIVLGIFRMGGYLTSASPASASVNNRILGYVVALIALSVITNLAATAGVLNIPVARVTGVIIAALGLFTVIEYGKKLKHVAWHELSNDKFERYGYIVLFIIIICLFLISLAPPTDADSLDYHLGVPLDWVRANGMLPRDDWNHARLVGLGESINLFGLLNGTDVLGQLVQFTGLWIVFFTITNVAVSNKSRLFLLLLVFAVPLNLFVATIQKPQLFQAALVFFVLISLFRSNINQSKKEIFYLLAILFYAIGSKISFIITGGIVYLYGMKIFYTNKQLKEYVIISLFAFSIVLLPVYLRTYLYYGDPISPMLEFAKLNPSTQVLEFAANLKESASYEITIANILLFPLMISIPSEPGLLSTVLGLGLPIVLFHKYKIDNERKNLLYFIIIVFIINLIILKQTQARYYMECYWLLIYIYLKNRKNINTFIYNTVFLQGLFMMTACFAGMVMLFPGALTDSLRDRVMTNHANGYSEAKWIDAVLPENTRVIANMRSHAFIPRHFVSSDAVSVLNSGEVKELIVRNNISAIFSSIPLPDNLKWIKKCADIEKNVIKEFKESRTTRNPVNYGSKYNANILFFNSALLSCVK